MEREGEEKLDLLYYLGGTATTQEAVAKVFQYGEAKHGRNDWKKHEPEQYLGAGLRHLFYILDGEELMEDDESGMTHIDHAIANLFMYAEQCRMGTIND